MRTGIADLRKWKRKNQGPQQRKRKLLWSKIEAHLALESCTKFRKRARATTQSSVKNAEKKPSQAANNFKSTWWWRRMCDCGKMDRPLSQIKVFLIVRSVWRGWSPRRKSKSGISTTLRKICWNTSTLKRAKRAKRSLLRLGINSWRKCWSTVWN